MSSSASTDTFPADVAEVRRAAEDVPQALERLSEEARAAWASRLAADVAETRRAAGITIAPEAALHRALQERTDELERVRAELGEALARIGELEQARDHHCTKARILQQMLDAAPPTAPDVGSTTSAPAAGAADPPPSLARARRRSDAEASARALAWARTGFGG